MHKIAERIWFMKRINIIGAFFLSGILINLVCPTAWADDAPVVSITPVDNDASVNVNNTLNNLPLDQRVGILERQISAMNQVGLLNQVNTLQQSVQDLQGKVQVLNHTLETLQAQSTSQYADLDARLIQNKPVNNVNSSNNNNEKTLYQKAYASIQAKHNAEGLTQMKNYLAQFPHGEYAANAHYWLGQLYVLKGDSVSLNHAVTEFKGLIAQYPTSDKIKDATLKLGYVYVLQNQNTQAKAQFRKVMKDYPGTSDAQLAESRLAQLP